MAHIEFPKWLYKNGVCAQMVNDRDEQEALLAEGFELPPSTEPEPAPCDGCAEREAKIADLEAQLAALVTKRSKKAPEAAPEAPAAPASSAAE